MLPAAMLVIASGQSSAQDAAPPSGQAKPSNSEATPLPQLEVTAAPTKKAKPKAAAKVKPTAAQAAPQSSPQTSQSPSAGASTAPGAVNGYVAKEGIAGT